jgi:hypothetical protein
MLAFRLWHALNNPPKQQALFRWVLQHAKQERPTFTSNFFLWLMMLMSGVFCWILTNIQLAMGSMVIVLVLNTLYGLRLARGVSDVIYTARHKRRYELLSALPTGHLLTSWAICTGYLHSRASFKWLAYSLRSAVIVAVFLSLMGLVITSFVVQFGSMSDSVIAQNEAIIPILVACLSVCLIIFIDHRHATIIGILVGMLAPLDGDDDIFVQLKAIGLYLTLQLGSYIVWYIIIMESWRRLQWAGLALAETAILEGSLAVVVLWIMQYGIVRVLWQALLNQANAESRDRDAIMRMAHR